MHAQNVARLVRKIEGAAEMHMNAYQLSFVPEPPSTPLLGLGGLALILRSRK